MFFLFSKRASSSTSSSHSSHQPLKWEEKPEFPGGDRCKFVETVTFDLPESDEGISIYRVMDRNGVAIDQAEDPMVSTGQKLIQI